MRNTTRLSIKCCIRFTIFIFYLMIVSFPRVTDSFRVSTSGFVRSRVLSKRLFGTINTIADENQLASYQDTFKHITPLQWQQLDQYNKLLLSWNTKINLISRKDVDSIVSKHLIPSMSISLVNMFSNNSSVIDIGTGGGLPGIPLAILFPEVQFTLVDSINKKVAVVSDMVLSLGLKNVIPLCIRAETLDKKFDYIVGRAGKCFFSLQTIVTCIVF